MYVLFHATAIYPGFQTTVHIGNIRQTAVIEGITATGGIHTNDRASVLFRFLRHPEYVKVGMRLLFQEGRTKGIGKITQVFPLQVCAIERINLTHDIRIIISDCFPCKDLLYEVFLFSPSHH